MAMAMTVPSTSHASCYDVFLSFRGTDTRYGFTGNLYKALTDKGIHTFIDDEELQKGDEITPSLVKAIHGSKIAIIVLSKHYASSTFCLDELVTIIDCNTKGLLVIPVFCKVDPSDVRHLRGTYEDALTKHQKRSPHKLQKWKEALRKLADLSGYHLKQGDEYEYKFIESIVDLISQKINHPARLHVADQPVGLESRVAQVMKLLDVGSDNGVHMVGILGMGGIGKSTLARAVYNELIAQRFDGYCYLENVREESEKHGLKHLQNILLQEILGDKKIKVTSVERGASMIPQKLQLKKVLLVIDDVDKEEQLKKIVGNPEWFGSGSRVIVTTRDQQLLACHQVKRVYELKELDEKDALQLLTLKAFKGEKADPSYVDVLNRALTYAYGLPLALEVIGSHLSGKSIEDWESAINQYKRITPKKIQDILKVSFDTLEEEEKSVFLDIVCCMKGYGLKEVEAMLSVLYDASMKYHIGVLIDKSLVKVKSSIWGWGGNTVEMHDLIQEMGRQIDHKESHKKPQKRKRLWLWKDIIEVLKQNKEASTIEIIHLDVPVSNREEIIEWDGNGFKVMKNLKILIIKNGKFSEGPKCLPNSLRVLEWWEYPSNCLPSDFQPHNFVMCNLPHSCFTSFSLDHSSKMSKNLKVLKFDMCKSLWRIPDLSDFSNLEELSFKYCANLVTVHESIGHLGKLKEISARGCMKLWSFPPIHLTSLEKLDLSYTELESFPEISGKMENIRKLLLENTFTKELPISFVNLVRLQSLLILNNDSGGVLKIPSSILMMPELTKLSAVGWQGLKWVKEEENEKTIVSSNLNHLNLSRCFLDDDLFSVDFKKLSHVTTLDLSWNNFTFLPECIKEFQSLRSLDVSCCRHLQEIRGVPPNIKYFDAGGCESLISSSISMFMNQELYEAGLTDCSLPGERFPEWFDKKSRGTSTSFWFRNKLPTNILYLLIADDRPDTPSVFINGKKVLATNSYCWPNVMSSFICKLRLQSCEYEMVLEKEWNHAEVTYEFASIKGTGIHVFKKKSREEDIRFSDPCRKRKSKHDINNRLLRRRREKVCGDGRTK